MTTALQETEALQDVAVTQAEAIVHADWLRLTRDEDMRQLESGVPTALRPRRTSSCVGTPGSGPVSAPGHEVPTRWRRAILASMMRASQRSPPPVLDDHRLTDTTIPEKVMP